MSYGYFCQSYVLGIDITIGQQAWQNSTIFHYITYPGSCTLYRMVKTGHIEGVKVGYIVYLCMCDQLLIQAAPTVLGVAIS
jgi:hypothetical protein